MSVQNITRRAGPFTGTGQVSDFPFGFKVFISSDVSVRRSSSADASSSEVVLKLDEDYTVTLNANQDENPGGFVKLKSALPTGYRLAIISAIVPDQQVTLTNHGGFYPETLNTVHDKAIALIQELKEESARSLKTSSTTEQTPEQLMSELFTARNLTQQYAQNSASSAAQSAASASQSAASASQSASYANSAAQKVAEVEQVKTTAIANIKNAEASAKTSIQTEGNSQASRVTSAGNTAYSNLVAEGNTQVNRVNSTGSSVLTSIVNEGNTQVARVTAAGDSARASVVAEGTSQVSKVNVAGTNAQASVTAAGDAQVSRIEAVSDEAEVEVREYGDVQTTRIGEAAKAALARYVKLANEGKDAVATAVASGSEYVLPESVEYVVGFQHLRLAVNGVIIYPGIQYTELGTQYTLSTKVTMLMPLAVGDEVEAWVVPVGGRLDEATGAVTPEAGVSCRSEAWTVTGAVAEGAQIALPNSMRYVVGKRHLRMSYNGILLTPVYDYSEVGATGDESGIIVLDFPLSAGDELCAWTVPYDHGNPGDMLDRVIGIEEDIVEIRQDIAAVRVKTKSDSRTEALPAGTAYTVPTYAMGTGALMVFLDGILCHAGDEYQELTETTISFTSDIPLDIEITVRVFS